MKKTLDFEDYRQCLFVGENALWNQLLFQQKLHEVHTIEVNKLALSRDDDKPVNQSDRVNTLAHGHKKAPKDVSKDVASGIFLSGSKDKKCKGVKKYIVKKVLVVGVKKSAEDDEKRVRNGSLAHEIKNELRNSLDTPYNGLDLGE